VTSTVAVDPAGTGTDGRLRLTMPSGAAVPSSRFADAVRSSVTSAPVVLVSVTVRVIGSRSVCGYGR
jgi:hypothetical protein